MLKTYTIPQFKLEVFKKKIAKMSNKAKRLGLAEYKVEYGEETIVEIEKKLKSGKKSTVKVEYITVSVEGEAPTVEGFKIIAMLEDMNGGNIVSRFDKESESHITTESLANRSNACEHCNSKRSRKFVFVLERENGELIQVGKSCLKDFTNCNFSADSIAKYYEDTDVLYELENITEEDYETYGRHNMFLIELDEVLAVSMYFTDKKGYSPSSFKLPTKQDVCNYLFNPKCSVEYLKMPSISEIIETYKEALLTVKAYYAGQKSNIDYVHNLQLILKGKYIEYKHIGYAVSAYSSYLKGLERSPKREVSTKVEDATEVIATVSEYVGEEGQRKGFELFYDRELKFEGFYGDSYMYFFKDENGNVLLWSTSKYISFEAGEKVELVGTIKEHKEYREVKQTVITRCKIAS